MHPLQVASFGRQLAGKLCSGGEEDGVKLLAQFRGREIPTDIAVRVEHHAFGAQLLNAALNVALLQLEVRDAVNQQAAEAVLLLKDCDLVPGTTKLLRRRQPCGSGADHCDALARQFCWRTRHDPALGPAAIRDVFLDLLDGDGVLLLLPLRLVQRVVGVEHAGLLAGCRTDAPRELREVVGAVQHVQRLTPVSAINEVVPVRDHVAQRTAGVAERDAAVHATGGLLAEIGNLERCVILPEIPDALHHRPAGHRLLLDLNESRVLAHL